MKPYGANLSGMNVRYERSHGTHTFGLTDGDTVTALSAPSWETFVEALETLSTTGGIIVSPELITTPVPVANIPAMTDIATARNEQIQTVSARHPAATVVLGSIAARRHGIANVLRIYENGQHITSVDKKELTVVEKDVFMAGMQATRQPLASAEQQLAICAELFDIAYASMRRQDPGALKHQLPAADIVDDRVRSLIVSSCWAVPMPHHAQSLPVPPEVRYGGQLERIARIIFSGYPRLQDIVMVDRAIPGSHIEPFNAHFTRNI